MVTLPKEKLDLIIMALEAAMQDGDLFFSSDEEEDEEAKEFIDSVIDELKKKTKDNK